MSKKYRLKINSGQRIIGPLSLDQIGELFLKGYIKGNELFQVFPVGDWRKVSEDKEIAKVIAEYHTTQKKIISKSKTIVKNIPKKNSENNNKGFQEFEYDYKDQTGIDYKKIDEKINKEKIKQEGIEEELVGNSEDFEKTRLIRLPPKHDDVDKTVLLNINKLAPIGPGKLESTTTEAIESEENTEEEDGVCVDEKTEFLELNSVLAELKSEAKEIEQQLNIEIYSTNDDSKVKEEPEDVVHQQVKIKKSEKKKLKPLIAISMILLIWSLLFQDEEKEKVDPKWLKISFPVQTEYIDEVKSEKNFNRGLDNFRKNTYENKLKAVLYFRKSLEYKFKANKSLGHLIYSYAELVENSKNRIRSAKTIFRLIEIARSKLLTDYNVAMGTTKFYLSLGKYSAAQRVIENFIRINKPSVRLFTVYLDTLIQSGDFVGAKEVYDKLKKLKNKPLDVYVVMAKYEEENQDFEKKKETLKNARLRFPGSVKIVLMNAKSSLQEEDFKAFERYLVISKKLKFENSPIYFSKYLEYTGILAAIKNKNKKASELFRRALKINETDELRSRLASLELGGSSSVETLIIESKIINLIKKSKEAVKEKKWEIAFNYAIEAADLDDNYIPGQLQLASIQTRRGYLNEAIKTLEKLRIDYPLNGKIAYALVTTYLHAKKLTQAADEMMTMSRSKLKDSYELASLQGQYYLKNKNLILSINSYKKSIRKNPVNDNDYFSLAKIYLDNRKYKNAKNLLNKAMVLDPSKLEYHILYAKILYDLEGVEVAIGYLRNILAGHGDDASLLGQITIYYYRNGQGLEFETYLKKLKKLGSSDAKLFEFLVKASELEDKYDDVIKYIKELIKVDPGNLEARMKLGSKYTSAKKYKKALVAYSEISERLPSYPKVNYELAKVHLKMNNVIEAKKSAELEISNNPDLEFGYYVLGEVYWRMKKYDKVKVNFEKSVSRNGKYVEALIGMGKLKRRQNRLKAARQYFLKALREDSGLAFVHKELGHIYKDSGQGSLAIESFKIYLELSPLAKDRAEVNNIIKRLR